MRKQRQRGLEQHPATIVLTARCAATNESQSHEQGYQAEHGRARQR